MGINSFVGYVIMTASRRNLLKTFLEVLFNFLWCFSFSLRHKYHAEYEAKNVDSSCQEVQSRFVDSCLDIWCKLSHTEGKNEVAKHPSWWHNTLSCKERLMSFNFFMKIFWKSQQSRHRQNLLLNGVPHSLTRLWDPFQRKRLLCKWLDKPRVTSL